MSAQRHVQLRVLQDIMVEHLRIHLIALHDRQRRRRAELASHSPAHGCITQLSLLHRSRCIVVIRVIESICGLVSHTRKFAGVEPLLGNRCFSSLELVVGRLIEENGLIVGLVQLHERGAQTVA